MIARAAGCSLGAGSLHDRQVAAKRSPVRRQRLHGYGRASAAPRAGALVGRQPLLVFKASVSPSKRRCTSASLVCRCGEMRSDAPRIAAKQFTLVSAEVASASAFSGRRTPSMWGPRWSSGMGSNPSPPALRAIAEVRSARVADTRGTCQSTICSSAAIAIGSNSNFVR